MAQLSRLAYFCLGTFVVGGLLYLVFREDGSRRNGPPTAAVDWARAPDFDDTVDEEPDEEPDVEVPQADVDEAPAVTISGRVLGPGFVPVSSVALVLGGEEVTSSEDGTFQFPATPRPRSATLVCRQSGEVVAVWPDVVSASVAEGTDLAASGSFESAPARLEQIRWTVNLRDSAAGDAGSGLWIEADAVLVEEWGSGARVQALGRTNLPDGAHVAGSLYFDDMRGFSSFEAARVSEGRFRVVLWGVRGQRLFSGRYTLKLSFNQVFEVASVIDEWKRDHPDIPTWDLTVEEPIFAGDEAIARAEDRQAQAYYIDVRAAIGVWKAMLTTRVREAQVLAKSWNPALLGNRAATRAGWFHDDAVGTDGHFAEDAWRDFLDRRWRPAVRAILELHESRGPQKYSEAEGRVQALLDDLLRESYVYSRFVVYRLFNLPGHANDFYQDESEAGDLTLLELRMQKNLAGLERFCRLVP